MTQALLIPLVACGSLCHRLFDEIAVHHFVERPISFFQYVEKATLSDLDSQLGKNAFG
jgi:hypothetical protein